MALAENPNPNLSHTVEVTCADGRVLRFTGHSRACKESYESFYDDSSEYVVERVVDVATGAEVTDWPFDAEGEAWTASDEADTRECWAAEWLPRVYDRCALRRDRKALALLFEIVDYLLIDRMFGEADRVTSAIDLARLDATCLVGLLTITFAAREVLPSRPALCERVKAALRAKGLSEERIAKVTDGLT